MNQVQHVYGWEAITPAPKRTAAELELMKQLDNIQERRDELLHARWTATTEAAADAAAGLLGELDREEREVDRLLLEECDRKLNGGKR
jgi:hypothetical protein